MKSYLGNCYKISSNNLSLYFEILLVSPSNCSLGAFCFSSLLKFSVSALPSPGTCGRQQWQCLSSASISDNFMKIRGDADLAEKLPKSKRLEACKPQFLLRSLCLIWLLDLTSFLIVFTVTEPALLFVQVQWDCSIMGNASTLPAFLSTPISPLVWGSSLLHLPVSLKSSCQLQKQTNK